MIGAVDDIRLLTDDELSIWIDLHTDLPLAPYATDIARAWALIEYLDGRGVKFSISNHAGTRRDEGDPTPGTVYICDLWVTREQMFMHGMSADTPSRAIARAFVRWMRRL